MSAIKTPATAQEQEVVTSEPRVLDRAAILAAADLDREHVDVPEWGGVVIVRALTGVERDAYEAEIVNVGKIADREYNLTNIRAKLVARTAISEDGRRLFSDLDVAALGNKNASVLDRLFTVAQRLSGLSRKDVDELADQMGKGQSADSGSA